VIRTHLDHRVVAILVAAGLIALAAGGALLTSGNPGPGASPVGLLTDDSQTGSSSATATISRENPGAVTTSTSDVIGRDRTQQSVAPQGIADSSVPAATGAALSTITTPPPRTLAMVPRENATPGSEYKVTVRVYGWGPSSGSIPTAVVLVTDSTPLGDVAKPFVFKDRNVLVRLDPEAAAALTKGGTYAGVITLRSSGDSLVPWLGDVGPAS